MGVMSRILGSMVAALCLAAGRPASAEQSLRFEEAMRLARARNKDLKAARERVAQGYTAIEQVRAALLPQADLQLRYTRNSIQAETIQAAGQSTTTQPYNQLD